MEKLRIDSLATHKQLCKQKTAHADHILAPQTELSIKILVLI